MSRREILQLEECLNISLKQIPFDYVNWHTATFNGYSLNNAGEINGLNLYFCRITEVPECIRDIRTIEILNLARNNIVNIPAWISTLQSLITLNLSGNAIVEIPEYTLLLKMPFSFHHLDCLNKIVLEDNPINNPPVEIISRGLDAIDEYYQMKSGDETLLNEVKILLVGDGGSGKTSIVKRIMNLGFNISECQTHGININDCTFSCDGKDINAHIWDFGGQEIMHATHQFFLSKRSLYIIVVDSRKDEKIEYWLKHVQSFGGNSPVLIVINKIDENPFHDVNRKFLQDKYETIKGFYRVSCKENIGIESLSKDIAFHLSRVELSTTSWPKKWFNLKGKLASINRDFIDYEDYETYCINEAIVSSKSQRILLRFLHDLGIFLYFDDLELTNTQVLNPIWITEAVYKIINSKLLSSSRGILYLKMMPEILTNSTKYPKGKYSYIINLMKKFELCYQLDESSILIPDLLDIQEPSFDFDYAESLRFLLKYDHLPRYIIPRLIVKMHPDIKDKLRWRTGVVLEDQNFDARAVIKSDQEDKSILISVSGFQKQEYFATILYFIREINRSFEKLEVKELVPLDDDSKLVCSYKHLLTLAKNGVRSFIPDGSEREHDVSTLLGVFQFEEDNEDQIFSVLKKIEEKIVDKESFFHEANKIIDLKPNFFGVGLNLNNLADRFLKWKKKRV